MKSVLLTIFCLATHLLLAQNQEGFFDFQWDDEKGRVLLKIDNLGEEFLYVNSLAAGIGSNDIGLDRGQLGNERIVKWEKVGEKILLIEPNLKYRAISDNPAEVQSMQEAFAQSVIGGFKIESNDEGIYTIDLAPFLLRDAHGIADRLKNAGQGTYKMDKNRSAVYLPNCLSFPDNTEFEAMITFSGDAKGREIRSVTPDPKSVTVRMHHSFVRLPDAHFEPRAYHPYSGYFNTNYYDYAAPIYESTNKKFIVKHRLKKKNPSAARSEAVEPIVYYIDPGCPEPIKSALMEGASWWNQAFEAAGFIDAFQVKELPAGAHPLDVRYNMIQWVHRSTRGWSYGASVTDPRTGEIIKGHVSLGSLRVRQDFLIAQGILAPYATSSENHGDMMEIALARLRQLSAHEVGHTIGLAHNFAASYNDRASVMDYPHPIIDLVNAQIDFNDVYDDKIGDWDKRTVIYGYSDFEPGTDETKALTDIIHQTQQDGYLYLSDPDARPTGGVHPYGHLWDNGNNPITELERISQVREYALKNFGPDNIPEGVPYSELEKVLVPAYLMHRYQVEAVSKLIGGVDYNYAVKGDALDPKIKSIDVETQKKATDALLMTVDADYLKVPQSILEVIPPSAYGYSRDRETFSGKTGLSFDPLAAAESATNAVFSLMFHPQRLSRLNAQKDYHLMDYLDRMKEDVFSQEVTDAETGLYAMLVQKIFLSKLIQAALTADDLQVRAVADYTLGLINRERISQYYEQDEAAKAHNNFLLKMMNTAIQNPEKWKAPQLKSLPPGSPIGSTHEMECGGVH